MATIINAGTTALTITPDATGTLAIQANGTTAVTVDTLQNVGIGTSSPATKLHVNQTNDALPSLQLQHGDGDFILMEEGGGTDLFKFTRVSGTNDLQINNITNNNIRFATNNAERLRILSDGNIVIGRTSDAFTTVGMTLNRVGQGLFTFNAVDSGGAGLYVNRLGVDGTAMLFYKDTNNVGNIGVTGSSTSYVTSSDYRLKKNIAPMTGALAKVAQLNPVTYKWKLDDSDGQGFIAHELAEVVPDCVYGEKDAVDSEGNPVHQGVDTSFLVATLTAAIQEQQAIIADLKARIEVLEAQ